jgi:hypothetical protein
LQSHLRAQATSVRRLAVNARMLLPAKFMGSTDIRSSG